MAELFTLFLAFLRVGLFAIGGAYSFLPLLEKELVDKYQWLSKSEFLNVLGIVKVFPGAISIKYATYTGYKIAGIPGAIVANIGIFLPPVIFVLCAAQLYYRYKDVLAVQKGFDMIQLATFAMIIAVAFQMVDMRQLLDIKSVIFVGIFFLLFMFSDLHPAFIVIGAGVIGAILR